MHAALSRLFRISAQVLVILVVPGGVVMVLVYQYRRFQKRRIAGKNPTPEHGKAAEQSPSN
jgi:hypothetical protein